MRAGLQRLGERREEAFKKFALKAATNVRFSDWFPKEAAPQYNLRTELKYKEDHANTNRLYKKPNFLDAKTT